MCCSRYCSQVFVKDLQLGDSWSFLYNDWLAVDRGSIQRTAATIMATTKKELQAKRQHNFLVKSTQDLRDGHLWISIFSKRARSTFTRVQRLTCALSLLLTTMLTNIMFYGIPTDEPEDQVGQPGAITISLSAIVIGIQSSLIMFPINLFIVQLFLRLKPRPSPEEALTLSVRGQQRKALMSELFKSSEQRTSDALHKLTFSMFTLKLDVSSCLNKNKKSWKEMKYTERVLQC